MYTKVFAVFLILAFSNNSVAGFIDDTPPTIFVRAIGKTKEDAFREAVRKASGVVINSQTESNKDTLVEDQILDYSSGFIQSYEVIKETSDNVEITALVASDKIANRILGRATDQTSIAEQSQQLYAQLSSIENSRKTGTLLLSNIVKDFPSSALIVTVGKLSATIDNGDRSILEFPITIKWSKNYLQALEQTVKYLSVEKCYACTDTIKFSNSVFDIGKLLGYKLSTSQQLSIVQNSFPSTVGVMVSFISKDDERISACYKIDLQESNRPPLNQLVSFHYNDKSMNFPNETKHVMIQQPINYKVLPKLDKIEAVMVKQCK